MRRKLSPSNLHFQFNLLTETGWQTAALQTQICDVIEGVDNVIMCSVGGFCQLVYDDINQLTECPVRHPHHMS